MGPLCQALSVAGRVCADTKKHGVLYLPIVGCLSLGAVIYAIAMATTNTGARYFAMMFTPVANGKCSSILPKLP